MSDKTNNLNQDSKNIQFDEGQQANSTEPNKQHSGNKATAPLKELPDTENDHLAETVQSDAPKSETAIPESSTSANDNKGDEAKTVEPIEPIQPIKPLKSASIDKSAESDKPETTDDLAEPDKVVKSLQLAEPNKLAKLPQTKELIDPDKPAPADESDKPIQPSQPEKSADSNKSVKLPQTKELTDPDKPAPTDEADNSTQAVEQTPSAESDKQDNTTESQEPDKSVQPAPSTNVIKPLRPLPTKESDKPTESTDDEQSAKPEIATTSSSPPASDNIKFTRSDDKNKVSATIHSRRSIFGDKEDSSSFLTFSTKKDDPKPDTNPDTAVLSEKSAVWRKVIEGQAQGTTSSLGEQREVLFVIRGMIERVVMKDSSTVTLGRFDTGTVPNEEIDLIPYGAIDRGVSRRHCKIQLQDNLLHVIDLQSTNGTFLAGVRLQPNEPKVLRKGDELLLGRLAVQVLFR